MITFAVWCLLTFGTGYVSLGSIAAAVVLPVSVIVEGILANDVSVAVSAVSVVLGVVVIYRHRSNISRLLRGEENRFGRRGERGKG